MLWQMPASLQPIAKWVERKYFVPSEGYEYLYMHPPPGSLFVTAANEREWQGQQRPLPKTRNAKSGLPGQENLLSRRSSATNCESPVPPEPLRLHPRDSHKGPDRAFEGTPEDGASVYSLDLIPISMFGD